MRTWFCVVLCHQSEGETHQQTLPAVCGSRPGDTLLCGEGETEWSCLLLLLCSLALHCCNGGTHRPLVSSQSTFIQHVACLIAFTLWLRHLHKKQKKRFSSSHNLFCPLLGPQTFFIHHFYNLPSLYSSLTVILVYSFIFFLICMQLLMTYHRESVLVECFQCCIFLSWFFCVFMCCGAG